MNYKKHIENFCTGCGLCSSCKKAVLNKNDKGFYKPDLKSDLNFFKSVCPTFHYFEDRDFKVWGDYTGVYEGFSTDESIRYNASSGGIITALSIWLVENNVVDYIIHTKADTKNPLKTVTVLSNTKDEILQASGSRYSVSAPLMDILDKIEPDKKYAFVGKPCDVASLKRYMAYNKDVSSQIVITMSFFCAGMPSDNINLKLLEKLGCSKDKLKSLQYRGKGWPGFTTAIDNDNNEYKIDYQTTWGHYLGRDVNSVCRYCMDGIGEMADIACADFWYLDENNKPDFSEHQGRNIIFCRNDYAKNVLDKVYKSGEIDIKDCAYCMDKFNLYQPYQFERRVTMKYKLLALKLFFRFVPKYNKNYINAANKYATNDMNKKIFIGTIKRILKGKM